MHSLFSLVDKGGPVDVIASLPRLSSDESLISDAVVDDDGNRQFF